MVVEKTRRHQDVHARDLAQIVDVVRRDRRPEIKFVRLHLLEHRIAVRDDLEKNALDLRLPTPAERISDERYRVAAPPSLVLEGPDADRQCVVRNVVEVLIFVQEMLWHDRRVGAGGREKRLEERRVWLLQVV